MQGKKKISTADSPEESNDQLSPQENSAPSPDKETAESSQPTPDNTAEPEVVPTSKTETPASSQTETQPVQELVPENTTSELPPQTETKAPPTISHGSTQKISKSALSGKYSVPKVDSLIKKVEGDKKAQEEAKREKPYTIEELKKHWEDYRTAREAEGKDRQVNLMNQPITIENDTISIVLSNVLLADMLDSFKVDLMEYLRDKVQNDYISITAVIKEEEKGRMLYTNREKFDHMATKNPALKKLQEKLGLDPDY